MHMQGSMKSSIHESIKEPHMYMQGSMKSSIHESMKRRRLQTRIPHDDMEADDDGEEGMEETGLNNSSMEQEGEGEGKGEEGEEEVVSNREGFSEAGAEQCSCGWHVLCDSDRLQVPHTKILLSSIPTPY